MCRLEETGWFIGRTNFQNLRVYQISEQLADEIWNLVAGWENFATDTVGKQMIRSADSIGANIAEGEGRGSYQDDRRFIKIARGSLQETRHWLRRAFKSGLLTEAQINKIRPLTDQLAPTLNAYLRSIGDTRPANDKGPMTRDEGQ